MNVKALWYRRTSQLYDIIESMHTGFIRQRNSVTEVSSSSRSPLHWEPSLQDECDHLLQFFLAAVEFGVYVAGLLLVSRFVLLSADAGIFAAYTYAQLSGFQDRNCRLVVVPASFFLNIWVSCGPCVVFWPQPAVTGQGSGSPPSQCVAPGLLWWGSSFLGWRHCIVLLSSFGSNFGGLVLMATHYSPFSCCDCDSRCAIKKIKK